jgi:hypothetical protein
MMPSPPPEGQELVVSIAFRGPVETPEQKEKLQKFKDECNNLAKLHGARIIEARLQASPKPPTSGTGA